MDDLNPLKPWVQSEDVVIIDGGLSTALQNRGCELDGDLWTGQVLLDDASEIQAVHSDYLHAGADVIITSSYQLSFDNLRAKGMGAETAAGVMLWSTEVALRARDDFVRQTSPTRHPLVASSIGPYGACLADGSEYRGDYGLSEEDLVAWHQPRFDFLAQGRADLLACETIPNILEVKALLRLIAQSKTPAWLSLSCLDQNSLADGTPLREVAALCRDVPNLVAVGVNCIAPKWVESALSILREHQNRPLIAYPNGGGTYNPDRKTWDVSTQSWGQGAAGWRVAGASLIGGCCQTTPEDIAELRALLRVS